MTTLKGLAVIWGSNLSTTATDATGGSYVLGVGVILASYDWTSDASSKEILNAIGDCAALVFSNNKYSLTIEVIPAGNTIAACKGNNALPKPGDTCRFVDPDSNDLDGTFSGDYIFQNGSKRAAQDGELHMTFNLVQYTANNLKNTIAA